MKTWSEIINKVKEQKIKRNWSKIYWAIDLHDSIISGEYNKFNKGSILYPYAKEVLDLLYNSTDNITILWTSSYDDAILDIITKFDLKFHYYNENPECSNNELCNFDQKFYFNLLLDDKSGFEPKDWEEIYKALTNKELNVKLTNKEKSILENDYIK